MRSPCAVRNGCGLLGIIMQMLIGALMGLVVGGAAGALIYWFVIRSTAKNIVTLAKTEAEQLRTAASQEAQNKAKEIELSARQQQLKFKEQFEKENDAATATKNYELYLQLAPTNTAEFAQVKARLAKLKTGK